MSNKIEEERDDQLCSMTLSEKKRPSKISNPIPIGHHTVSGHEASALAKRLNEELASQQSASGPSSIPRALSPDCEPISRSFEHGKSKGNISQRLENVWFNFLS